MSDSQPRIDEPDDGGQRPSGHQRATTAGGEANEAAAPDRPVGDFGDEERADPGGDSDVDPVEPGRG